MKATFWLSAILLAGSACAAELPVRQVVLYKHGVGYFQRSGELRPGESAQLDFKADEMNDVLKSLTIQESGTGSVTGLRYDSSEPLEKKLAEFPFRLGERQPLAAVLDQLKGAQMELKFASETVTGRLLGDDRVTVTVATVFWQACSTAVVDHAAMRGPRSKAHSSSPTTPSSAAKNSVEPTRAMLCGKEN